MKNWEPSGLFERYERSEEVEIVHTSGFLHFKSSEAYEDSSWDFGNDLLLASGLYEVYVPEYLKTSIILSIPEKVSGKHTLTCIYGFFLP